MSEIGDIGRRQAIFNRWEQARRIRQQVVATGGSECEEAFWNNAPEWRATLGREWVFGDVLITFDEDISMYVDLSDHIESQAYLHGMQEGDRGLVRYLKHLWENRPDMVFLDIGANVGLYTLLAAKRLKTGTIASFEAVPDIYNRLMRNLQVNSFDNVHTWNFALGSREGDALIWVPTHNNKGMSSLYRRLEHDVARKCRIRTLDAWWHESGLRQLDVIKLDVEGAEIEVLKGGLATVVRCRPIIAVELSEEHLNRGGTSIDEATRVLLALDYEAFLVEDSGALRENQRMEWTHHQNAVFIPKGMHPESQ